MNGFNRSGIFPQSGLDFLQVPGQDLGRCWHLILRGRTDLEPPFRFFPGVQDREDGICAGGGFRNKS